MNFLTLNMLYTLLDKLVEWDREPEKAPRIIIMKGAGDTAFCSGGDMRGLYDAYISIKPKVYQPTFTGTLYRTDNALANMKPIHIAIWNGYVFGSGAGICMRAPFTIATDNTEWAMPENVAGFIPDNGSSRFFANIRNCDLPIGLYLAITGARVTGKNILKFGICSHFVPKDKLNALEQDLITSVRKTTSKDEINTIINKYAETSIAKSLPDNYHKI